MSCGEELRWLLAHQSKSPFLFSISCSPSLRAPKSCCQSSDSSTTEASSSSSPLRNPNVMCCLVLSFPPQREAGSRGFLPILWLCAKVRDYGERVSQIFLRALMWADFILMYATGASQLPSRFLTQVTSMFIDFETVLCVGIWRWGGYFRAFYFAILLM